MKTHSLSCTCAVLITLAFTPLISSAQTPSTSPSNSKGTDSTADQNNGTTGNAQTGSPDQTSSKTTTNSLDKNPSLAPTGSDDKAATKTPTGQESSTGSSSSQKFSDSAFILKAAQGGMTEVELGKLAQDKGTADDVKQFGSHMVMDHSKANDDLKALAAQKGVTVPSALDAKHQAMVDKMSKLSGAAFDHAYVQTMVNAHEKDAADFSKASTSAHDSDVKAFAAKTLEMVKAHLADIKSIQSKMK